MQRSHGYTSGLFIVLPSGLEAIHIIFSVTDVIIKGTGILLLASGLKKA